MFGGLPLHRQSYLSIVVTAFSVLCTHSDDNATIHRHKRSVVFNRAYSLYKTLILHVTIRYERQFGMFPAPVVPFIRMADYAVRKPWRTGERKLLDYLLIYFQAGSCTVTIDQNTYDVPAGSFCFIQPNELHTLHGKSNTITPFAHFDVFYNPLREESFVTHSLTTRLDSYATFLQPRLNDVSGVCIPSVFIPTDAASFRDLFLKMIGTWKQGTAISMMQSQQYALGLLAMLLQQYSPLAHPLIHHPESLNWLTAYCSFHLNEPLTIAQLATRAHRSPSYFSLVFRKRFGTSPHQYILQLRVQRAQELLENTQHSLSEIAAECGFADVHHFSKAFTRRTNCTPRAFRARHAATPLNNSEH